MSRPEQPAPVRPRLHRRAAIGIAVALAVLLGVSGGLAFWFVRGLGEAAAVPSESIGPPPSPTAAVTPDPTPSQSAAPTSTPQPPPPTPVPTPQADPAVAELVFSVSPWNDIISPFTTSLAADGRLVTTRVGSPEDGALLLEQRRLTDRGIELIRDEILSTGLFDESAVYWPIPLPGHELPGRGTSGYAVDFGTDAGVVQVDWSVLASDEPEWAQPSPERERLDELGARLIALDEWLPPDAWADPTPRPYQPARYRLFTTAQPWGGELEDLPPEASEVVWPLAGTLATFGEPLEAAPDSDIRCAVVSAEDAERVGRALAESGTPLSTPLGERRATGADRGDRAARRVVQLVLVVLHPHENSCTDAFPPSFW